MHTARRFQYTVAPNMHEQSNLICVCRSLLPSHEAQALADGHAHSQEISIHASPQQHEQSNLICVCRSLLPNHKAQTLVNAHAHSQERI